MNPNWFAYIALFLWPAVAAILYFYLPANKATVWTILGAFLLLPYGLTIKFETIPGFDKDTIPNICALIGCMLTVRRGPVNIRRSTSVTLLVLMYLFVPVITSYLNSDTIVVGKTVLQGVGIYDGISALLAQFLFFLPFLLGRQLFHDSADVQVMLRALVFAALVYSVPMLFEVRFSPQLHNWVYGYMPRSFLQQMREGGFRPMVFTGHGLIAALFMSTALVAAATLWRLRARLSTGGVVGYFGVILVTCKSYASLGYGIVFAPQIMFLKPRTVVRVASLVVLLTFFYPLLRSFDLFPTGQLVSIAEGMSQERADSLKFRFDQEKLLLDRASERPAFGWGRYGRSRIYDETGKDVSVTDGRWIITLGQFGLLGFIAEFGLLLLPVLMAASALRYAPTFADKMLLAGLSAVSAINTVDLLPNAALSPWNWLIAGALLGRAEALLASGRLRQKRMSFAFGSQQNARHEPQT